jgi:ribonucleoside-diphosphate reductase alpha chain
MLLPHVENLLKERYWLKNELKWEDSCKRWSEIYPEIYNYILGLDFMPSTPTLMNLNTKGERKGTLSSCFILDVEDSIDGIMDAMKEAAFVTKAAGGVGYNWSKLRGANENVKSISANSGGILSFIQIFDSVLDGVRQGGRRRGAGMSMVTIYHPDILKFINAKLDITKFTRSNFSVVTDNAFYKTLKNNPDKIFRTRNVVDKQENDLLDDEGKPITYKQLWDRIIENAWTSAEPGIFNGDIAADQCTCKHITKNVFSNPCSEYVHIPYTSCNLGSINLSNFVTHGKIDFDRLKTLINHATRYLNQIIDNNDYPLKKIKDETLNVRPIGLGAMGLAHMLYKLGVPYASEEAQKITKNLIRFITLTSMRTSVDMAIEKGKAYPYFDYDTFMDANKRFFTKESFMDIDLVELQKDIKKHGCYNSCQTSIAPTGSISFIADTSSGIEPVFGLVFTRKIEKDNKQYEKVYIVDPVFKNYIETKYPSECDKIYEYVSNNKGSCKGSEILTREEEKRFMVAGDISPEWHLNILQAVANNTSLSVSKTINLPKDCSKKELGEVFLSAHEKGIIGVTVYRDGCREGILVHKDQALPDHIQRHDAPKRPVDLECDIHEINVTVNSGRERFVVLVGKLAGTLYECFVTKDLKNKLDFDKNKTGIIRKVKKGHYDLIINNETYIEDLSSIFGGLFGALSRSVSTELRHGVPLQIVVEQLQKDRFTGFQEFDKCVARVLKHYIAEGEQVMTSETCPQCGSKLIYIEGCKSCEARCGWAKCG